MSHHIMPLAIISLGDGRMDRRGHTHTHTLQGQDEFLETRRAGLWPARAWFKNNNILKAFHITDL